jgi:nucleoid-associated protein YgaU
MTSDAKIGLLLGLIFIFVIAFIINGLPNLRPQPTKGELPTTMMPTQDENLGLADREQKARETISWGELLDTQSAGPEQPAPAVTGTESSTPKPEPAVAANDTSEGIRSILPLPGADGLERLTKGLEDIMKNLAEVSGPAAAQEKTTELAPMVDAAKPERTPAVETAGAAKPSGAAAPRVARTYVVQDGENLASVAKKVYGAEEGNRMVNIQRIYEANRDILPSADKVRVGQELVIPPVEKAKVAEKTPANVLPGALFEKAGSIGKNRVAAVEKKASEKPATPSREPEKQTAAGRWYVVRDGDSVWKIAATQLGSGARYEEIVKLNPDVLKDSNLVDVGTRLRLPSK